ncbi:MAG TPA: hypothetical protein VMW44_01045 [Candidatus Bathyarchaeia archaeon]|nr:hypothetical protein [Candidatus Bathyarchaeia archaeon]
MLEITTRNKVKKQWQGTQDNNNVKYAIETARTFGNSNTVDQNWRWLAENMGELYQNQPEIAAATYSYINGWISGASDMLNRAFQNLWK